MMIKTKTKNMYKGFLLWKIWEIMILKTTLSDIKMAKTYRKR